MKRRELFSDDIEEDMKRKKALSPDARENQLIAYATNLAEKQLMEGTASSQVIVHYLKLGSSKERLEKKLLEEQVRLAEAKTEVLQSTQKIEQLYADAINAMRRYTGHGDDDEYKVL